MLGVDPGMASTGLAAVSRDGPTLVEAATVRTPADALEADRLLALHRALGELLDRHRPESMSIERLMWGRNVGSAMMVARASGVVLLAAAERGIPVHEYAPLEVKMAIAGSGTAGKTDVRRALQRIHRLADVPKQPDAADAVAVAMCHLLRSPALTRLAR